jgi:hypothetical protein
MPEEVRMTDFGLIGKAIDYLKSSGQDRKEKKLREGLVEIVHKLDATGENTYRPTFGSAEYWEAVEMAKRGWLVQIDFGFMRPPTVRRDSLHSGRRRY